MGLILAVPSSAKFLPPSHQPVIALLCIPLIASGKITLRHSRRENSILSPTCDKNTNNTRKREGSSYREISLRPFYSAENDFCNPLNIYEFYFPFFLCVTWSLLEKLVWCLFKSWTFLIWTMYIQSDRYTALLNYLKTLTKSITMNLNLKGLSSNLCNGFH